MGKARSFTKLAKDIDTDGNILTSGFASSVEFGASVEVYDSIGLLPYTNNTAGDQAFVKSSNRLYIWQGSGWYNVALINNTPNITSITDADAGTTPFLLATDGTATVVTIVAADSDGDPITYSVTKGGGFDSIATLSQDSSVFTITPFSQDSAGEATSGTLTFQATDGINTATSAVQTFTLSFVSEYWDEVALSIGTSDSDGLDNKTFIDRSTNAHSITAQSSPVQSAFHPYLDNWSVYFDGTEGISFGDHAFGSGDWTIEAWINPSTVATAVVLDCRPDGTNGYYPLVSISTNQLIFHTNSTTQITTSTTLSAGQWYHIAVVRNSGTTTFYINGTSEGTWSDSSTYASGEVRLADGAFAGAAEFDGYISNFRAVVGTAVYTSNFTPPTEKLTAITNTIILSAQSNRFIDNSSSPNTVSITAGSPEISAFNPFGQGSEYVVGENKGAVYLNGSSYLTLGDVSDFNDFSTNKTIQFWIYPISTPSSTNSYGLGVGNGTIGTNTLYWSFGVHGTGVGTGTVRFASYLRTAISSSNVIQYNAWNHLTAVYTASSNNITLYLNGAQVATGDHGNAPNFSNSVAAVVGAAQSAYLTGYIADLQISDSAVYTSAFTHPTSPVGATGADYYIPMDNAGIFDKTGNSTLTLNGDVATSTSSTKFADTSMYFDGTGDRIEVNPSSPNIGTSDFTIEMWINVSDLSTNRIMYDARPVSTQGNYVSLYVETNGAIHLYNNSANRISSSSGAISTGTWYHIALCRSSSNTKLFVDGTQVGSTYSDTINYGNGTNRPTIGGNGDNVSTANWSGYLENVQVLNGVAKYTANFTVPTQEQGRIYQADSA